jgi:steroid 5-alpha reductase family enzyme
MPAVPRLPAADPRLLSALWPGCVGALAVLYANVSHGAWTRRSAIAWMMGSWGARLTVQALYTRASAPAFAIPLGSSALTSPLESSFMTSFLTSYFRLLTFSLFSSLPALIASRNPDSSLSSLEIAASVFWAVGFAAETTADRQLLRFASNPGNAGLVCRSGIWRHVPRAHAVCETAIWTAFALFAFASPWGWIALACPAAIAYLHRVSPQAPTGQ